jgi:hypothetical protein
MLHSSYPSELYASVQNRRKIDLISIEPTFEILTDNKNPVEAEGHERNIGCVDDGLKGRRQRVHVCDLFQIF